MTSREVGTSAIVSHNDENPPTRGERVWNATATTQTRAERGQADCATVVSSTKQTMPRIPASKVRQKSIRPPVRTSQRMQCTHVTVKRDHSHPVCHACGNLSEIGWVYRCTQDTGVACGDSTTDPKCDTTVGDEETYFEAQAKVAASLGMTASVISQMRNAQYSFDQIETLLAQRRYVLEVIQQAERPLKTSGVPSSRSAAEAVSRLSENIIASAGTKAEPEPQVLNAVVPSATPTIASTKAGIRSTVTSSRLKALRTSTLGCSPCDFQVCHACRPFFRERLPMSFGSMLYDDHPAITIQEVADLPLLRTDTASQLGLRSIPVPSRPKISTNVGLGVHQHDGKHEDSTDTDWTPTTSSSSDGEIELTGSLSCHDSEHGYYAGFHDQCRFGQGYDVDKQQSEAELRGIVDFVSEDTYSEGGNEFGGLINIAPGDSSVSLPEDPTNRSENPKTETGRKSNKPDTVCGVLMEDEKTQVHA